MEFPHVGLQCQVDSCNQLDYLYYKCSGCHKILCHLHHLSANHDCPNPPIKDEYVICCPLCRAPLPGKKDEDPNIRVDAHIAMGCPSQKREAKVCGAAGCKKKIPVPFTCPSCSRDFCVSHRFESDHKCTGKPSNSNPSSSWGLSMFGQSNAATPTTTNNNTAQNNSNRNPQRTSFSTSTPPSTSNSKPNANSNPSVQSSTTISTPKLSSSSSSSSSTLSNNSRPVKAQSLPPKTRDSFPLNSDQRKQLERDRLNRIQKESNHAVEGLTEEEQLALAIQQSLEEEQKRQKEAEGSCLIS